MLQRVAVRHTCAPMAPGQNGGAGETLHAHRRKSAPLRGPRQPLPSLRRERKRRQNHTGSMGGFSHKGRRSGSYLLVSLGHPKPMTTEQNIRMRAELVDSPLLLDDMLVEIQSHGARIYGIAMATGTSIMIIYLEKIEP